MKKGSVTSQSAPSISSVSNVKNTVPLSYGIRRSASHNALPLLHDGQILEAINGELQIETVLHVPALHAGTCAIEVHKFPFELKEAINTKAPLVDEDKALANCLLDTCDDEEINNRALKRPIQLSSYLDLCEYDEKVMQRYAKLLYRVRKSKKKHTFF